MINKGNRLMTEVATGRDIALNWDVLVTPGIPTVTSDLGPDPFPTERRQRRGHGKLTNIQD